MKNRSTKLVARKAVESLCILLSKFSVCSETRRKSPVHVSLLFLFAILSSPVSVTVASDGSLQSNKSQLLEETSSKSLAREIVFIDSAVEDQSLLIKAVRPDAEVILLSPDVDGVSQIAQSLRDRSDVSAIHIVSHGHAGQLLLGSSNLNSNTLRSYLSEINTISAALSKDADILLYGCNVAQGDNGKAFISKFAEMTNADVAASENVTGDAEKGGDWVLENRQGEVQVGVVFSQKGLADYKQLLAAPVFTSVPASSISVAENASYSKTLSASDADGDDLTYSLVSGPDWVSVSGAALSATPSNGDADTYSVTIRVSDGSLTDEYTFSITVTNTAPVFTSVPASSISVAENASYSKTLSASDAEGGDLTYSLVSGPDWVSVSGAALSATPSNGDADTYSVTIRVSDGSLTDEYTFSITVTNTAPVFTSVPASSISVAENASYSKTLSASDAEGGDLTYSLVSGPDWVSVSGAALSATPSNGDADTYSVTIRVSDGSLTDEYTFSITVTNTAPVFTSVPASSISVAENASYSKTLSASDADGDDLTYSLVSGPSWVSVSGTALSATPSNGDADTYSVTIRVSETSNPAAKDEYTFSITVTNTAPVFTSVPASSVSVAEDASYSHTLSASDAEGGDLTYSLVDGPSWLSVSGSVLSGTPRNDDVGTDSGVKIQVSDPGGEIDEYTFSIMVTNTNDAPLITSSGITSAQEDTPYGYTLTATDVDGDNLTYRSLIKPSWLSFDPATRKLTGTPTDAHVGVDHNVTLQVDDNNGATDEESFIVKVSNVNDLPTVNTPTGELVINGVARENETLSVNASVIKDDDGIASEFTYQWMRDGKNINGAESITYFLSNADVGKAITVAVKFTDSYGANETVTSIATDDVVNVNDSPTVNTPTGTLVINGVARENETLSVNASVIKDKDGISSGFTYQWRRGGVNISNEVLDKYTLVDADVGKIMTVVVKFTDDNKTEETLISDPTKAVENVNDIPVGKPEFTGSLSQGAWLTANTKPITDEDGIDTSTFKYQWLHDDEIIVGANFASYELDQDDANKFIKLVVEYVDNHGTTESVTSLSQGPINDVNVLPKGIPIITGIVGGVVKQNVILGVDTSEIKDGDGGAEIGNFTYQWKSDGIDVETVPSGPTYQVLQSDVGKVMTVQVFYTDNGGTQETVISDPTAPVVNVNDIPTGQPVIKGEAIEGVELTVDTLDEILAIKDIDGLGEFSYQWLRNGLPIPILEGGNGISYTLVQADVDAKISLVISFIDGGGQPESVTSLPTVPVINVNDPPVGLPIIAGSPIQNGVLEVDTSFISDIDGLGDFSYQWLRDGAAISDAIGTSYTLVQADVGTFISIVVSYIDGQSTLEEVFSETLLDPVGNINDPGVVVIDSIPEAGLAIDFVELSEISLTDIDGTSSSNFEYQWLRDGEPILGATNKSYFIPENIHHGAFISLEVTYTDDLGEHEVVLSNAVGPIFPDVPTVVPPDAVGPFVSTGWFTFVEIEKTTQATAVDGFDGALIPFSNSNSQFRPGVTGVIWKAVDSAGNENRKDSAIQDVKVIPLVDINKGQISAEGASVQVKVALNGNAINYPVTVPYTVSGTADANDHTLMAGSVIINEPAAGGLPEGLINFEINPDGLAEGTETVVINLGAPTNAVLRLVKQHTVQIVEGNVAPLVSLSAVQSGVGTMLRVVPNGDEVVVSAVATDVNGDGLGYDWSGTDVSIVNMDIDTNKATFTFDPGEVEPGFYTFNVSVSDGSSSVKATLVLEVLEQTPSATTKDSDGDGIVDYFDSISASHILQQKQSISNAFLIQTEPGLKLSLGETAFRANNSQSMVTKEDVVDYAFSGVTGIILLDEIENIGGYFDFIVDGIPIAGDSVKIVLPQLAPLPKLPVYRKLTPSGWQDFVEDEKNAIHSAAGSEGYCPPPGDAAYQPGLSEGRLCVQLTIEDGGPNDLDGLVNNSVTDPGGVSRFLASVSVKSSGGGGGATNPLLLLSVFFMLLYYRNGKHLVRKVA